MTISTLNSMTSGTSSFNLNLTELCEEAYERAGYEMRSGYDLRTARRSLNLLFADWANRGINMWTMEQGTITLQQGLNTYALPTDTVDLLSHVIRTNPNDTSTQADLTITRISVDTYATLPNKLTPGRPIQVWVQRLNGQIYPTGYTLATAISATDTTITLSSTANMATAGFVNLVSNGVTETIYYNYISGNTLGNCFRGQNGTTASAFSVGAIANVPNLPAVTVWPTPDGVQTYQFVYWRMRRTQDIGCESRVAFPPVVLAEQVIGRACRLNGNICPFKNFCKSVGRPARMEIICCDYDAFIAVFARPVLQVIGFIKG